MKKVILIVMVGIVFSGCSTRMTPSVASTVAQMYETTKTIWVKGQEIVVINSDLLDDKTLALLDKANEQFEKVDAVKMAVVDGNMTKLVEDSDRVQETMKVITR